MPLHDVAPGNSLSELLYSFVLKADQSAIDTNVDGPMAGLLSTEFSLLELFFWCVTDDTAKFSTAGIRFNGDTGSNYNTFGTDSSGSVSTASSFGSSSIGLGVPGNETVQAAAWRIVIPGYALTTFHKARVADGGYAVTGTSDSRQRTMVFRWANTAAINRISLTMIANTGGSVFKAGSGLLVYARS